MLTGRATTEGTARFAARFRESVAPDHFREFRGLRLSSLGLGTYLGREDVVTDQLYTRATARALGRAINVVDTAINYRHQRSERAIGAALADLVARGVVARDEVVIATKGGYLPFDGVMPRDPAAYFAETYVRTGLVGPADVAGGAHCMTPRYLADQIEQSRANLGLATLDVYHLHNPETQLEAVGRDEFLRRLREAFAALEDAVREGRIACYGTATWNGYRQPPGSPAGLLLDEVVACARAAGGEGHHLRMLQLPYNLAMTEAFTRANQPAEGAMVSLLEAARRHGLYVMTSASVYQGQLARNLPAVVAEYLPGLATDAQRALQFARSTPGVGTALVGMKSPAHVDEDAAVAAVPSLPWEQFQRLFSAT